MVFLGAFTKPLTLLIRSYGAIPRSLADDIALATKGEGHWPRLREAGSAAQAMLQAAGAVVAFNKCALFSTARLVRARMRIWKWPLLEGKCIPVANHARDLGAHLSFSVVRCSGTLGTRYKNAIGVCHRIANVPARREQRHKAVLGKVLPMALYGNETTLVSSTALRSLGTTCKKASGVCNFTTASPLLLAATWGKRPHEPFLYILMQRIKMVRRMWHDPSWRQRLDDLLIELVSAVVSGACHESEEPAIHHSGIVTTAPWLQIDPSESRTLGPSTLLLATFARLGARMDAQWRVYCLGHVVIDVMLEPWQSVHSFLVHLHREWAFRKVQQARDSVQSQARIDWHLTLHHGKLPRQERNLLRAIMAGAIWTDVDRWKAAQASSAACFHCNHHTSDLKHLLWHCPAFSSARQAVLGLLRQERLDFEQLPQALLVHGLAPVLPASVVGPIFGQWSPEQQHPHQLEAFLGQGFPDCLRDQGTVLAALKGRADYEAVITSPSIQETASSTHEIFTDGSAIYASDPVLRYGGAAVLLSPQLAAQQIDGDFHDFTLGGGGVRGRGSV